MGKETLGGGGIGLSRSGGGGSENFGVSPPVLPAASLTTTE